MQQQLLHERRLSKGPRCTELEQWEKAKLLKHSFGLLKIQLHQGTRHVTEYLPRTLQTLIS